MADSGLRGFALFSVLGSLLLTLLLEALDQTVVSTALPRIISTLQGFDRYTWSVTAYALASITAIPIVGKLSDQFGRKGFLLVGTVIFLVGSVLSGAAQNMDQFIAFRALQGLGAGVGIGLVFSVIADIFTLKERLKWQSLFGVVYGFSNLVGPTIGGLLTDHGPVLGDIVTDSTRWRWVFYINLPVGLLALVGLVLYLPTNRQTIHNQYRGWAAFRRIDFVGAILIAGATVCLLLGLTWGSNQDFAWDSVQVLGILGAAAVLTILFVVAERFAAEPIIPFDLFRNRNFTLSVVISLLQFMALIGLIIYLPLYLQGILGESATSSGEVITPFTLSSVVGAMVGAILMTKIKKFKGITIIGAVTMLVGVFLMSRMDSSTSLWVAIIFMIITGLGVGPFFSILTLIAQNAVPRSRLGVGTGAARFFAQLGGVLGVAVVGTVVNNTLSSELGNRLPAAAHRLPPQVLELATNPQALVNPTYHATVVQAVTAANPQAQGLLDQIFNALKMAFETAIQQGFLAVLLMSVLVVVGTLFFKDVSLVDEASLEAEAEMQEEEGIPVAAA
jgi:EmrB/QacA subfamily drug resistance transporter